ncbi:jmjC domain-containing histone demethylation protein 1-like isoform X1 [Ischnura elegans]|uniref:jmjC domain-containing histone demethylation protein 1-like isoform X1 n=1 Tax=Ischnura elegans TaxID=197161 RepID=UPI001ED874FB|nr:jmjC domain-containing histone demethylation protein 1-like isoform X1 [Ischnura elegans]
MATAKPKAAAPSAPREYIIRPRDRKERKHYTDDWTFGDDEIDGKRSFRLEDKIESDRFTPCFVKEMQGADFNLSYLQRHGFNTPLLFKEKAGLGLRVPSCNFSINDVRMCVGSRRILDVMDVNTQKNLEMTMKEWQKYYEEPQKEHLLNVISLEFSHTRLENYVQTPALVRQIDWVDTVWPRHLKESQIESTNVLDEMMYPKVQKYCLMSVRGCYTDFHVDFGGTSVWYHILKGSKIFWLIPPTERNLALYEQWVLSGKQSDVFFADTVERCARVKLHEGNTFFIPTGWIHAVYTPCDSLVFGGNFLHSFGIEKQLMTAQVEDSTHVPQKFRYPFFTEMLWYVLERYVFWLLGHSHLDLPEDEEIRQQKQLKKCRRMLKGEKGDDGGGGQVNGGVNGVKSEAEVKQEPGVKQEVVEEKEPAEQQQQNGNVDEDGVPHVHLTPQELHGLKAIVKYLHSLPSTKKNVPELIRDPIALIRDVRTVVERHRHDSHEKAITGLPILQPPEDTDAMRHNRLSFGKTPSTRGRGGGRGRGRKDVDGGAVHIKDGMRRRRTRCKKCEACNRKDCGDCSFCHDMVKFGGPGRAKQTCVMRQCLQPMLPVTAGCLMCKLDGWYQQIVIPIQKTSRMVSPSTLMECSICYEIVHPDCVQKVCPDSEGIVNEDLPNSWECPKCCKDGKNVEYKPRHFRARQKSTDIRRMSIGSDTSSMMDTKERIKSENMEVDSDGTNDGFSQPATTVPVATSASLLPPPPPFTTKDRQRAMRRAAPEGDEDQEEGEEGGGGGVLPEKRARVAEEADESQEGPLTDGAVEGQRHQRLLPSATPTTEAPPTSVQSPPNPPSPLSPAMAPANPPTVVEAPRSCPSAPEEKEQHVEDRHTPSPVAATPQTQRNALGAALHDPQSPPNATKPGIAAISPRSANGGGDKAGRGGKVPFRVQLARQLSAGSATSCTKILKKPMHVVRPAPPPPLPEPPRPPGSRYANPALDKSVMLPVFERLSSGDLCRCMRVCRAWNRWSIEPRFWRSIDLSHRSGVTAEALSGVVRRQPECLCLDWSEVGKRQLVWLLGRLPKLRELSLQGCPWGAVAALRSAPCPPLLTVLDLSFVTGLDDSGLREIVGGRGNGGVPGSSGSVGNSAEGSRGKQLRSLKDLRLAGCDISDTALLFVAQQLRSLTKLNLSACAKVTDVGIGHLMAKGASTATTLQSLDISGCRLVTEASLNHLKKSLALEHLDCRHTPLITSGAVIKFAAEIPKPRRLVVVEGKLVVSKA